ncbi:MAG: response regulator [Polyangiaceae bacterium]
MGGRILVVDDSSTIRKVVSSILERNAFKPVEAKDGQFALEELERDPEFELILLDFVMPRMNGYQFCRELRSKPDLKNLPIVLMSAKGDKIRGQFVQQTGAIDAITKPFDARGLIAVVEGAIHKHKEGRARPVPDAETMLEEDDVVDSLRPSSLSWSRDGGVNRVRVAMDFADALADLLRPELLTPAIDERTYQMAFQRMLTPDTVAQLGQALGGLVDSGQNADALTGNVSVISIAEVLQLLSLQRQTGSLTVRTRKGASIVLFIKEGNLSLATSAGLHGEFRVGRYLVQDGALKEAQLSEYLEQNPPSGSRARSSLIGQALIERGLIDAEQLHKGLTRQASELIYEVVRWNSGRFSFKLDDLSDAAQAADLGLPTGAIVMEGFRRVDEWRLIEGSFDFENVLYQDPMAIERMGKQSELTKLEATVLAAIDGERTVREIVAEVHASSFDVCKILYQFVNSRLVRIES